MTAPEAMVKRLSSTVALMASAPSLLVVAVAVTVPAVAVTRALRSSAMSWPHKSTVDTGCVFTSTVVAGSLSSVTSVMELAPSVTDPLRENSSTLVSERRCTCVSRATKRMEPLARMEVVAETRPFWLTAKPAKVTLPRSAEIRPASAAAPPAFGSSGPLVTVPPSPTSTNRPRRSELSLATRKIRCPAARIVWPSGVEISPRFVTCGAKMSTCPPSARMLAPCSTVTEPLASATPPSA